MKYFPFPVGCQVALTLRVAQKGHGPCTLTWLLVLLDFHVFVFHLPHFITSFSLGRRNLVVLCVLALTKQTAMVDQHWLLQT